MALRSRLTAEPSDAFDRPYVYSALAGGIMASGRLSDPAHWPVQSDVDIVVGRLGACGSAWLSGTSATGLAASDRGVGG